MKRQFKMGIFVALFIMGLFMIPSSQASANPLKNPIFIGEVTKVEKCSDSPKAKLTVDGYMKGCGINKGEMIILVDGKTKVYSECKKNNKEEKIAFEVGDYICVALSNKITKSIPPQGVAKAIQITNVKERAEKETSVSDTVEEKDENKESPKALDDEKTFDEEKDEKIEENK